MKVRRIIALWMLLLYCLAVGGSAAVAFDCSCPHASSQTHHHCTEICTHDSSCSHCTSFGHRCNHSTNELEVFAAVRFDENRGVRPALLIHHCGIAPEALRTLDSPLACKAHLSVARSTCCCVDSYIACAGLRAPPVVA